MSPLSLPLSPPPPTTHECAHTGTTQGEPEYPARSHKGPHSPCGMRPPRLRLPGESSLSLPSSSSPGRSPPALFPGSRDDRSSSLERCSHQGGPGMGLIGDRAAPPDVTQLPRGTSGASHPLPETTALSTKLKNPPEILSLYLKKKKYNILETK